MQSLGHFTVRCRLMLYSISASVSSSELSSLPSAPRRLFSLSCTPVCSYLGLQFLYMSPPSMASECYRHPVLFYIQPDWKDCRIPRQREVIRVPFKHHSLAPCCNPSNLDEQLVKLCPEQARHRLPNSFDSRGARAIPCRGIRDTGFKGLL